MGEQSFLVVSCPDSALLSTFLLVLTLSPGARRSRRQADGEQRRMLPQIDVGKAGRRSVASAVQPTLLFQQVAVQSKVPTQPKVITTWISQVSVFRYDTGGRMHCGLCELQIPVIDCRIETDVHGKFIQKLGLEHIIGAWVILCCMIDGYYVYVPRASMYHRIWWWRLAHYVDEH